MRVNLGSYFLIAATSAIVLNVPASMVIAQDAHFHNAPASSNQLKNPYAGQPTAAVAGSRVYATNCGLRRFTHNYIARRAWFAPQVD
jgi:hypothetical protein